MSGLMLVALMPLCLGALLAALPSDGTTVRDVFEILGWVFGLVMLAWRVFGTKKETPQPQPFRIAAAEEFVNRREFEELKSTMRREHDDLRATIEGRFNTLDRQREATINGLHKHITDRCSELSRELKDIANSIGTEIGTLEGRLEARLQVGNNTMVQHSEQIAALNERTAMTKKPR